MEIRVLRYFLTVAREGGINRAAEVLHITQPTLSRQMSSLEDEVGVKLFHRGAKKITLTNEGILLRRRAEEILALVDKTEKELIEQEELIDGKITVGCGELAAMQLLPDIFRSFSKKYPLVSYDLYTANADEVKEQMEKGLVDIGVLLEPVDIEKFDFIRLEKTERWVVLMRSDDPLAEKESISAGDLCGHSIILPRRLNIQSELASWFGDYFKNLHILFTSNLNTNGALMVHGGMGYSLVVEGAVPFCDQNEITCRPLRPELLASSVLAWKRGQPFGLAAAKFIEHLKISDVLRLRGPEE